ncbi:MAG: RNA 2',3'-cyclic phosphodiesterase [Nitrospinae bacterium CG11_big_fil_rev_8_21_14_0_20_56_8]|nr:MAG: RNA 2',3'-cyclic phosphodiesterase [Nitrospinae bacterium CG11_big_fil_rev_8_21_14_0_20_56_8]
MRLFIAIPIPDTLRTQFTVISAGIRGARWVRPEGMHITLNFCGETDRKQARDLDTELSEIKMPAFDVRCSDYGYFERGTKIKSVWAGIENNPTLMYLHDRVETATVKAGFERENRKYKPHITLARLKLSRAEDVGQWIETHDTLGIPPFTVDQFILYRSHLAREGAMYEPLVVYPLG